MRVLVTGGAGYIGSHCCQRLLQAGHEAIVIDNLVRGHRASIDRLVSAQDAGDQRLTFIEGDLADRCLLDRVFGSNRIDAVMHFAALAYVRESVDRPLAYYRNNCVASLTLIERSALVSPDLGVGGGCCQVQGRAGRVGR